MKTLCFVRTILFLGITLLMVVMTGCRSMPSSQHDSRISPPQELLRQSYLFEIVRHLYRWHLDETEIDRVVGNKRFVFWIRRIEANLDPGDHSILGEILLPDLSLRIKVKKADYQIEELGTTVKSQTFKITQVARADIPDRPLRSWVVIECETSKLRDYLFRTRNQRDYPDAVLVDRLRQAVRLEAAKEGILSTNTAAGDLNVHLAPLSPVANETWVFWEAGHKLFYFASDIDLNNPTVWEHEALMARIFDLDQQVVVSHEEAPGSNRFLTRYQVSRALFNCVILGQRVALPSADAPPRNPTSEP